MSSVKDLLRIARINCERNDSPEARAILEHFEALASRELGRKGKPGFRRYLREELEQLLEENGIRHGRICELGGPYNSFADQMPPHEFEHISLYPVEGNDRVRVGDIATCDHIESERYDAVISISVFEHIAKPWDAARHIVRLTKPGGIVFHAAPFSYFYHGAPADFWRYTPDAMKLLFADLLPLRAEFYGENRRRDNRGSPSNPVDGDGGPAFAVDAFGGWRENWFTIYAGRKDPAHVARRRAHEEKKLIVNAMKTLVRGRGLGVDEAAERLSPILRGVQVATDGDVHPAADGEGIDIPPARIAELWRHRGRHGVKVDYRRHVVAAALGL